MKLAERKRCMGLFTAWMKRHGYDAEAVRIKLLLLDAYSAGWGAAVDQATPSTLTDRNGE